MTDERGSYESWIGLYERAWADPAGIASLRCATCGSATLRLIFVVRDPSASTARAVFWCETCLNGLIPLRAPVPDGADVVAEGQERVPDYHLIVEE